MSNMKIVEELLCQCPPQNSKTLDTGLNAGILPKGTTTNHLSHGTFYEIRILYKECI
jgi:hypothetical protein